MRIEGNTVQKAEAHAEVTGFSRGTGVSEIADGRERTTSNDSAFP
jgi:hypothetical protein